ncbi:hypothetical protein SDC9_62749 [bioreactor metagenome]|uniref:Bacterial repeat domain-containing protein n=1 Tax=bioreactor metagenome TaxID=1076179 RepID=A0A644XJL2_9ZZZZ
MQGNSFTDTGKVFIGWNTSANGSGTTYYPGDSVLLGTSVATAPGDLYAIWEDQTFGVTVTASPAAGISASSGAGIYVYNTDATVGWTVAAGYELTGVTDNGVAVPANTDTDGHYVIRNILEDHAVVIQTKLKDLTLTYNGNGGTAGGSGSYGTTKTMGASFSVDANTFTRSGYYFLGWSTNAGATAADSAYAPGASVVMPGSNLTLYAVWAAKTAVTLTANSASLNYDGSPRSVSGISASVSGLTVEVTTAGATGTNPGVYPTSFVNQAGLVLKSGGVDVTERYTVSWANGSLTINPQVTYRVSANSAVIGTEWVAYGTGDATYNVTPPANVTVSEETYYWLGTYSPATANDLTANTTIYASYARNKALVITADSASYVYDGTQRTVTTGTVDLPGLTVTGYTVTGSGTNVGTYATSVTLDAVKIMSGAADVTHQYSVSTVSGMLTITPANMTVTSGGYTGTYDNQPHGITVTPDIAGSDVKYSLTNSANPADYGAAYPTVTDATAGTTVYFMVTNPNYRPVFDSESIVINRRTVRLATEGAEQVYSGMALTNPNWAEDSDSEGFVTGQGFATASTTGTITNVGTANNGFTYTLTTATKQGNYTVDVTEGVLKVTKANTLSVDATDYSGKYDGIAHGVTAAANVPDGTTIRYSLTNSANPADYTLSASPTARNASDSKTVYFAATNGNYEPAFGSAEITVTPRAVTIDTDGGAKVYDGTALTARGWSVNPASDGFVGSEGFATASTTGTITNAGTAENGFVYTLKSTTLSGNYKFAVDPGTLAVTPRTVMIAATDASKNYSAADPAFAYSVKTGTIGGANYYSILPADLTGVTVSVTRRGYDSEVGRYPDVLTPHVSAIPSVESNYLFSTETADFTINPQVVYKQNTTDRVTGLPPTSWFDLGTDATLATAAGVQRVGYHLVGWEDATTGEPLTLGGTIPAISANHTLNALWEIAYNDVVYVKGTADPVLDMPDNLLQQQYGGRVTISGVTPYHSGYGFLYWKTTSFDGTEKTFNPGDTFTMPDAKVVLLAVWEARSSPIYYHDGMSSGRTVEQGRYPTDSTVTVAGNMFTNPGYRFLGWSQSAGGAVTYQPGSTFTMPARQVNLYAVWEEQTFTVTYIVSGGTGALDGTTPYATFSGLKYGDATPVPSDPALEGYTFDGWTTVIPTTVADGNIVIYGTMSEAGRGLEEIPNAETPLAGGGAVWALLNLVLAIATALASILMLVGFLGKKKEEADGGVVRETKKHGFTRMLTLVPGIGGIIAFILTENMKNPMAFTDRWTLLMILIAAVQLLLVLFGAKRERERVEETPKSE